jgi:prepilin-type N-terminal cleavage/methylation domain-containing protein
MAAGTEAAGMGGTARGDGGFSLIELMVVILILGVLVAIAVPVFFSARSQSEVTVCQDNLRTMDGVISEYDIAHGAWPGDVSQLAPEFLREVPACPTGGTYSLSADVPPRTTCSAGHTY